MVGAKKGKGTRQSRDEWRSLLAQCDESGLDIAALCRREAISATSLYRWRRLLGGGGQAFGREKAPGFVDLGTLNPAATRRPWLELKFDLGDGLVLHLVRS